MLALNPADSAQLPDSEEVDASVLEFKATAYCDEGLTKSGAEVAVGMVAADPAVLPLGSMVCVEGTARAQYDGIYQVMDTGRLVKGQRIDIYIPSLEQATDFGCQDVRLTVLRSGYPPPSP